MRCEQAYVLCNLGLLIFFVIYFSLELKFLSSISVGHMLLDF